MSSKHCSQSFWQGNCLTTAKCIDLDTLDEEPTPYTLRGGFSRLTGPLARGGGPTGPFHLSIHARRTQVDDCRQGNVPNAKYVLRKFLLHPLLPLYCRPDTSCQIAAKHGSP